MNIPNPSSESNEYFQPLVDSAELPSASVSWFSMGEFRLLNRRATFTPLIHRHRYRS